VGEGQLNQWGTMRWADFCVGMTVRLVSPNDLPVPRPRSSTQFVEVLAKFRADLRTSDQLYHFDSNRAEWDRGMGSEGYAIVRDGELLDTLVVMMN
jgi:hypothetical protein